KIPITVWTVLTCLVVVSAATAWLAGQPSSASDKTSSIAPWWRDVLAASTAVVGVTLLIRSGVSPLIGYDAAFRWDFLGRRILALKSFAFYPPLLPADFHDYFALDGIPPLVSFTHWWMYASAGRYLPILISLFVTAQFAATLAFTYGA